MCGIVFAINRSKDNVQFWLDLIKVNARRGPDHQELLEISENNHNLEFYTSVLHLRGQTVCPQPLQRNGDILLWNGEIFSGIQVNIDQDDTSMVLDALQESGDVISILNRIHGPFAFVFYSSKENRIYFGRDCLGRRSLLWKLQGRTIILASTINSQGFETVPANGIYSISLASADLEMNFIERSYHISGNLRYPFPRVNNEINVVPLIMNLDSNRSLPIPNAETEEAIEGFLRELDNSVRRRIINIPLTTQSPLCILFSGGIDCMVLAILADRHLPKECHIDLVNVAFENQRTQKASKSKGVYDVPDRKTGKAGLLELQKISPKRKWNFIEVDIPYSEVLDFDDNINRRMCPSDNIMDQSIARAFWFAARTSGKVDNKAYISPAKVLFSGLGADEQLGGYVRHRTAFENAKNEKDGWMRLVDEIRLDFERISDRNLGRDDRIISDHAKEVRFPYLDEDVVAYLSCLPIHKKMDMRYPKAIGDKLLLRHVANRLGLCEASLRAKRAIQFGARSAKMKDSNESGDMKIQGGFKD